MDQKENPPSPLGKHCKGAEGDDRIKSTVEPGNAALVERHPPDLHIETTEVQAEEIHQELSSGNIHVTGQENDQNAEQDGPSSRKTAPRPTESMETEELQSSSLIEASQEPVADSAISGEEDRPTFPKKLKISRVNSGKAGENLMKDKNGSAGSSAKQSQLETKVEQPDVGEEQQSSSIQEMKPPTAPQQAEIKQEDGRAVEMVGFGGVTEAIDVDKVPSRSGQIAAPSVEQPTASTSAQALANLGLEPSRGPSTSGTRGRATMASNNRPEEMPNLPGTAEVPQNIQREVTIRTDIAKRMTKHLKKLPNNYLAGVIRIILMEEEESILPRILDILKTSTLQEMDKYVTCVSKNYSDDKQRDDGNPSGGSVSGRQVAGAMASLQDSTVGTSRANHHGSGRNSTPVVRTGYAVDGVSVDVVDYSLVGGVPTNNAGGQAAPATNTRRSTATRGTNILRQSLAMLDAGGNNLTCLLSVPSGALLPSIPAKIRLTIWKQPSTSGVLNLGQTVVAEYSAVGPKKWHVTRPIFDPEAATPGWTIVSHRGIHLEDLPLPWCAAILEHQTYESMPYLPLPSLSEATIEAMDAKDPHSIFVKFQREGAQGHYFSAPDNLLSLGGQLLSVVPTKCSRRYYYKDEPTTARAADQPITINMWYVKESPGGAQREFTSEYNGVPFGTFHSRVLDQLFEEYGRPESEVPPIFVLNLPGFDGATLDLKTKCLLHTDSNDGQRKLVKLKKKKVQATHRSDLGFLPKTVDALHNVILVPVNGISKHFVDILAPLLLASRCADGNPIRVMQIFWVQNERLMDDFEATFKRAEAYYRERGQDPVPVNRRYLFRDVDVKDMAPVCYFNFPVCEDGLGKGVYLESSFAACDARAQELRCPELTLPHKFMMVALTISDPAVKNGYRGLFPQNIWRDNMECSSAVGQSSHGGQTHVLLDTGAVYPQFVVEYEVARPDVPVVGGRYRDWLGY